MHRIGRTGRCGNTGKATSFFDPDKDRDLARELVSKLSDVSSVRVNMEFSVFVQTWDPQQVLGREHLYQI